MCIYKCIFIYSSLIGKREPICNTCFTGSDRPVFFFYYILQVHPDTGFHAHTPTHRRHIRRPLLNHTGKMGALDLHNYQHDISHTPKPSAALPAAKIIRNKQLNQHAQHESKIITAVVELNIARRESNSRASPGIFRTYIHATLDIIESNILNPKELRFHVVIEEIMIKHYSSNI